MRSRTPFALGASLLGMVAAGIAFAGMGASGMGGGAASVGNLDENAMPPRRHRGKGRNNRRGTGKVAKSRKRPNMRTVSKRVRNKHRRAARGR